MPNFSDRWLKVACAALGAYALAGGTVSLLGWRFDIPRLTDWIDSGISIQPNASIAVAASGAALILLTIGHRKLSAALGLLVAFTGLTVHVQNLFGVDLGIDALFRYGRSWGNTGVLHAGRMGPPGATSWSLIGVSFLLSAIPKQHRLYARFHSSVAIIGIVTAGIASLSIIGYFYGASGLYSLPRSTVIALQTATFVLAVSCGLVFSAPEFGLMKIVRDSGAAGIMVRRTVPALILGPTLIGLFVLRGQQAGLYDAAFGNAVRTLSQIGLLAAVLWWTASAIRRHDEQRRRAEDERDNLFEREQKAHASAVRANRLKDEFLATLSHELRNPLNVVLGYSDLLLRNPVISGSEQLQKMCDAVRRNAQTQAQLINDLLDLSRLQSGKMVMNFSTVSISTILSNAVETVQPEAESKQVQIEMKLPEQPVFAFGDGLRLQQVVWNIMHNAVKFTPSGGRISAEVRSEDGKAVIVIADTGQGITPDFLPHVFEMFRQADASSSRRHGGMGIGLALVQQIVLLHGGEVIAESAGAGLGATFTTRLPLHEAVVYPKSAEPEGYAGSLAALDILVVDDSEDTVDMLRAFLQSQGARVTAAASAEKALHAAQYKTFDAVLTDISMPGMDGFDFLRQLRNIPGYETTPVFALTGHGQPADIERTRSAGFRSQFTKPVELNVVANALNEIAKSVDFAFKVSLK